MSERMITLHKLDHPILRLKKPIPVRLEPLGSGWLVTWSAVELYADGKTEDEAVGNFKREIINYFISLRETPKQQHPKLLALHLGLMNNYLEVPRH